REMTTFAKRHGWVGLAVLFALLTARRVLSAMGETTPIGVDQLLRAILDVATFAQLGESVLRGDLTAAYSSPFNQAGPLQIVLDAVLRLLVSPLPATAAIAVLCVVVALVPLLVS